MPILVSKLEVGQIKVFTLTTQQDVVAEVELISSHPQGFTIITLNKPCILSMNKEAKKIELFPVSSVNPLIRGSIDVFMHSIIMMYDPPEEFIKQYKAARSGIKLVTPENNETF